MRPKQRINRALQARAPQEMAPKRLGPVSIHPTARPLVKIHHSIGLPRATWTNFASSNPATGRDLAPTRRAGPAVGATRLFGGKQFSNSSKLRPQRRARIEETGEEPFCWLGKEKFVKELGWQPTVRPNIRINFAALELDPLRDEMEEDPTV
mgnify:CR=1 FL=1